jgi:hypothetical protein
MLKGLAEIIKAVGRDPRKMWTMVILLFFVSTVTIINKALTKSDCTPLVKQNEELVKSQSSLVDENQSILIKNKELVDGYDKIQELLTHMKPDTVYITKTTTKSHMEDVVSQSVPDTLNIHPEVKSKIVIPEATVYRKVYRKSNDTLVSNINDLISKSKVKNKVKKIIKK